MNVDVSFLLDRAARLSREEYFVPEQYLRSQGQQGKSLRGQRLNQMSDIRCQRSEKIEDLQAALAQFAEIASDLRK
jgi:hypothetical protein